MAFSSAPEDHARIRVYWASGQIRLYGEARPIRVNGQRGSAIYVNPDVTQLGDEIAAAAVRALEWDAQLPAEKLKVTVSNGWVTLRGTVEWQYEREDAERVVRRLIGVKGVTNLIVVNPTIKPKELKRTVEEALKRNAHITDPSSIAVDVDNTKVILKGKVRTWEEREEAEQTAWRAHGVTDVDNRLMITFGLLGL